MTVALIILALAACACAATMAGGLMALKLADKLPLYERVWRHHALLRASMLQDLEKGRKTEIDAINGYVVERGREAGVATPFNRLIVELIRAAEARKELPDPSRSVASMRALLAGNRLPLRQA